MNNVNINEWLDQLAAKQPTPGGGAVAALSSAISAAQLDMVASYTTGPKYQTLAPRIAELKAELSKLKSEALELVSEDAQAFSAVGAAYQLPKDSDAQKTARNSTIQKALILAATPPTKTAELATKLIEISIELAEIGNPNVISDVSVGASLAKAALESAIVNIEINQHSIHDQDIKKTLQGEIENATDAIQDADAVTERVRDKIGNA